MISVVYLIPTQIINEDYVTGDLHKERLNKTYPKILGREQSNSNKNALHIIGGGGVESFEIKLDNTRRRSNDNNNNNNLITVDACKTRA